MLAVRKPADQSSRPRCLTADAGPAVVLTKDVDFVELLARLGPPPSVVWLTCGNTSNAALRELLAHVWPRVSTMLQAGEPLIEIAHAPT
jgi:predicted nuclease of predicted toxin-antitoxin system